MKFANALRPSRTKWTRLRSVEWKRRRGEGRRRVENAPRYYLQSSYKLPSQVVIDGRRNEERTNERRRKNVAEGGRKDEVKLILLHFSGTFLSVALPFSVSNVSVAPSGRVRFRQTKKKEIRNFLENSSCSSSCIAKSLRFIWWCFARCGPLRVV